MANPNQVAGRAKVKLDGVLLATAGSTVLDLGGTGREVVKGDFTIGFRETYNEARLEVNILTKRGFSARAFGNLNDVTVSIEFDSGQSYVMRHAFAEGPPQMTSADGQAKGVLISEAAGEVAL